MTYKSKKSFEAITSWLMVYITNILLKKCIADVRVKEWNEGFWTLIIYPKVYVLRVSSIENMTETQYSNVNYLLTILPSLASLAPSLRGRPGPRRPDVKKGRAYGWWWKNAGCVPP